MTTMAYGVSDNCQFVPNEGQENADAATEEVPEGDACERILT
jgi:hypothetical protein